MENKTESVRDRLHEIKKRIKESEKTRINNNDESFLLYLSKPAGSGGLTEEYRYLWKRLSRAEKVETIKASRRVMEFWAKEFKKKPEFFFGDRKKIIERLITDFREEECKDAILGCKASPFHMGENENRTVYNSIELIFRNSQKTRKFISYLEKPKGNNKRLKDDFTDFWRS